MRGRGTSSHSFAQLFVDRHPVQRSSYSCEFLISSWFTNRPISTSCFPPCFFFFVRRGSPTSLGNSRTQSLLRSDGRRRAFKITILLGIKWKIRPLNRRSSHKKRPPGGFSKYTCVIRGGDSVCWECFWSIAWICCGMDLSLIKRYDLWSMIYL